MRTSPRLLLTLPLALAAACAHAPPPLRSATLELEDTGTGPRPMVKATVAGRPMRLLLDTGAARSVLPWVLVREGRLPAPRDASATEIIDSGGTLIRMPLAVGVPVILQEGAAPVRLDFLLNPKSQGEEGLLVPQEFLSPGWAVTIDLGEGTLRYDPQEEALQRLSARGPVRALPYHGCSGDGLFGRQRKHRVVSTVVNGVEAGLMIDTGSTSLFLARNHPALSSLSERSGQWSKTSNLASTSWSVLVPDVPLDLAGDRFVTEAIIHQESQQCGKGVLGASVLRHCTMVWGWSDLWMSCRPPGGAPPAVL